MGKVGLILWREYITRVRTKSFLLSTILVPVAIIALMVGMIVIAINSSEKLQIAVKDENGYFEDKFRGLDQGETLRFKYRKDETLETLRKDLEAGQYDGVLYIPELDLDRPLGIRYYGAAPLGPSTEDLISDALTDVIKSKVLEREGYDQALLKKLEEKVTFETIIKEETKTGASAAASGVGYIMGFIIYLYMFIYGAMVMKGVSEEKTNRIVEVMLSAVKPFELMLGKILGIGLVGLTQFTLWVVGIFGAQLLMGVLLGPKLMELQNLQAGTGATPGEAAVLDIIQSIGELDLTRIILSFFFYFLFGYLFFGAQFAAVGAATTDDTDANAYTFPISMPIILSIVIMNIAIQQPGAPIAFWSSMIPFFSPVVMLARLPFDVAWWEQLLSMALLAVSAIGMVWIAGRVYRVGILIQGKKVSFKDLGKWIFSKY
jgi:ABC-2 type transport system permease protein